MSWTLLGTSSVGFQCSATMARPAPPRLPHWAGWLAACDPPQGVERCVLAHLQRQAAAEGNPLKAVEAGVLAEWFGM
jgi:hypothetical protein